MEKRELIYRLLEQEEAKLGKDMYISNIDKEYYYRKNLRMNLFPAFRYDEKGVSSVFTSYYVSDKNMVLAYIEVYESKLVEIRKYYKSKALKLK